jgi:predicted kinase
VVAGGFPLVIDATFLRHRDREAMGAFAAERGLPRLIVSCRAPADTLRRRIRERCRIGTDPSDADVAVMEEQRAQEEPLSAAERGICVPFAAGDSPEMVIAAVTERLGLRGQPAEPLPDRGDPT